MRLPEMGWFLILWVVLWLPMYHKYYIQQVYPEMGYMGTDPWGDNPNIVNDKFMISTELEKIQFNMWGNRNLYHHVFRYDLQILLEIIDCKILTDNNCCIFCLVFIPH